MSQPIPPFLDLKAVNLPYEKELCEAAERVIKSGRYIGGDEVKGFEDELAQIVGTSCAVGVSNGLDALRLILRALIALGRLHEGDEVIVPANTYIATVLAVTDSGLKPLLVDPDEATMNLSGRGVEAAITPRTRAILPVHLYGRVAWDEDMRRIALERQLIVVEDVAQAVGARAATDGINPRIRNAGALGHAGAFSFYPTKNIGALGDAGAVTTSDPELAAAVHALANYGSDYRYHNIYQGFNCRLDPIQAAMLRVKLRHVDEENADRFARAVAYENTLANPLLIKPLIGQSLTDCVWHQYVIRTSQRDCLAEYLHAGGIPTDIHYPTPPHLQPCYKDLAHGPLPITERLAHEVLSLPIGPDRSVKDVADIARYINQFSSHR